MNTAQIHCDASEYFSSQALKQAVLLADHALRASYFIVLTVESLVTGKEISNSVIFSLLHDL